VVWPWVAAGKMKAIIDDTFPLAQAAEAHVCMNGDHVGKVVLTVD
jgi:NADPH:quinone reductase-like Zn-dependent oxidoreductase